MSSKTPKVEDAKTASVPRFQLFSLRTLFYFGLFVATWLSGLYIHNSDKPEVRIVEPSQNIKLTKCMRTDVKGEICQAILEVADDDTERMKGLSGRDSLDFGRGMLFEDTEEQLQCFWMKDMKFPLDIIWIDNDKKIIKAEYNVAPESYPKQFCGENTRYVIELNAGRAEQLSLGVGQSVDF